MTITQYDSSTLYYIVCLNHNDSMLPCDWVATDLIAPGKEYLIAEEWVLKKCP
jgi:hypothetical protein